LRQLQDRQDQDASAPCEFDTLGSEQAGENDMAKATTKATKPRAASKAKTATTPKAATKPSKAPSELVKAPATAKPKAPAKPKTQAKAKAASKSKTAAKSPKATKLEPGIIKQTTDAISQLAADILADRIVPTLEQIKSIAASALAQDQTKGKRQKKK
jgi:hypothetical protein